MERNYLLEVCVDHLESAKVAQLAGANRIELCQALDLGGLTPSAGLIMLTKAKLSIPIYIMIRPRSGDFFYTEDEVLVMIKDIQMGLCMDVDGFVFGALKDIDDVIHIDIDVCRKLMGFTGGKPVTFHRAFDVTTCDVKTALNDIIALGFTRILTSGRSVLALDGVKTICHLVEQAGERIIIMPGSGLDINNMKVICKETKATEFHSSGLFKMSKAEEELAVSVVGTGIYKIVSLFIVQALLTEMKKAKEELVQEQNNECAEESAQDVSGAEGGAQDGSGAQADAQDGSESQGGAQDGSGAEGGAQDGSGAQAGAQDGSESQGGAQDGSGAQAGAQDGSGSQGGAQDGSGSQGGAQDASAIMPPAVPEDEDMFDEGEAILENDEQPMDY